MNLTRIYYSVLIFCLIMIIIRGKLFARSSENNSNITTSRKLSAIKINNELNIDGNLTEEEWEEDLFSGNFIQWEPENGKSPTEKTKVAITYNNENIYIGIKCYDREPDKIISKTMRRDVDLIDDDSFHIVLDTYNDKRNGFYFGVNPNGSRRDGIFNDEGKNFNWDWDAVWQCEAEVSGKGWFAEIAIPWKILRFERTDSLIWGVNFSRIIRRRNEHAFWQHIPREIGSSSFFRVSLAGKIEGLSAPKKIVNFNIEPYFLTTAKNDITTGYGFQNKNNWGFDSKINITSNILMNFTWNTDFAQVEADQARINLTRFPIYFPEKRGFFLEGAEMFNFGGQSDNNIELFYSRRIGIKDGHQQPIHNGVKLFGKAGKYQLGLINVMTEDFKINNDFENKSYNADNSTVFRIRREIFKRATIGLMFLNRQAIDSNNYNRSLGLDINFPFTQKLLLSGSIAGVLKPGMAIVPHRSIYQEQNLAGNLEASYNSDSWEIELSYLDIQDNFTPKLGYVPRTDIKRVNSVLMYSPRIESFDKVRKFGYRLEGSLLTNHNNIVLNNRIAPVFIVNFENSSDIFTGIERNQEFIESTWEVRPGFMVPKDNYKGINYFLWFQSDQSKDIAKNIYFSYGDYYTGRRLTFSPSLDLKTIDNFTAHLNWQSNYVSMPEGDFQAQTFGCRLYYYFSTKFYVKAYLQYNDDKLANGGNRISLTNLFLRWTYRPGSDLYIVYNDTRLFGNPQNLVANRSVMLKLTYFWGK